jgi:hypothetical protein
VDLPFHPEAATTRRKERLPMAVRVASMSYTS